MSEIIINDQVLNKLGLNPEGEYQVIPKVVHDVLPIKVNTALQSSYDMFTGSTTDRSNARRFVSDSFPNDNAFIFNDLSFYSDLLAAVLGSASTRQTQEYFRHYTNLVVFQDTTELMRFNLADYQNLATGMEDATLITRLDEWKWHQLAFPFMIGKREQLRFDLQIAPGGLTSANISAEVPYINSVFNDGTSVGFTVLEARFRGVMLVQR